MLISYDWLERVSPVLEILWRNFGRPSMASDDEVQSGTGG